MKRKTKGNKILYFYAVRMSFVAKDIEILNQRFRVAEYHFNTRVKWKIPLQFIRQLLYVLKNTRSSYAVVCFFSGYHSFLPAIAGKIFKKPVLIFIGGSDAYAYPSFHYGHFNKFLIGRFTCLSARMADLLLPVDECLMFSESDYYTAEESIQGIRHFCKKLNTPHRTIRLEYDPTLFFNRAKNKRENSFITAAFGIEGTSFIRKGIDMVIEVAHLLPDCHFSVIGCSRDAIRVPVSENVHFIPPVPYKDLAGIYSTHRFYLQMSIAEGFPSAICEAMLCECVPIGSNVAAIPFIIGETGFIVNKRDVLLLKEVIGFACRREDLEDMGQRARERIIGNFYPGSRSKPLFELLDEAPSLIRRSGKGSQD